MTCCYYRTYEGSPCFGGLRTGVTTCDGDTYGHLVAPAEGEHPSERLPICAQHWMMRQHDLKAPYSFVPARGP